MADTHTAKPGIPPATHHLYNDRSNPMANAYTYMHSTADTRTPFYIGKGTYDRAYDHRPEKRGKHWSSKVAKHGLVVDILSLWETDAEAHAHEIFLIKTMREIGINLVNKTDGGEGTSGYKWSEEAKTRLSCAAQKRMRESGNPMSGKKHSDQSKLKMSAAKQGVMTGGKHPRASITEEQASRIKSLKGTMTAKELSEAMNVSFHVVRNIWSNKSWSFVRG